jgi:peptide/nickel transport system substrate-binding protein
LTNGIVPKHLLQRVDPIDLRSATFNTADPVGAGPFRWSSIGISGVSDQTEAQITLAPFSHYWAGMPRLTSFSIYAYADQNAMIAAYRNQEITSMVGLDHAPVDIANDKQSHIYNLPFTAGVYVFFQTTAPPLDDPKVRQALVAAADRSSIIGQLGYPAVPVDEPVLKDQFAYDPSEAQITDNAAQATALLDAAGWQLNAHGMREKNGQTLSFTLTASDGYESKRVATMLVSQWRAVGIDASAQFQAPADFQSNSLALHQYDAVLDGVSIGADPDVYVYWDSSQNDPRSPTQYNFSKYSSTTADLSLEAGRTRLDPLLRKVKYKSFLQAWQQDAPALGLYQPRLLYISHENVYGLAGSPINTDADRFRNVQNWMIHTGWVTK